MPDSLAIYTSSVCVIGRSSAPRRYVWQDDNLRYKRVGQSASIRVATLALWSSPLSGQPGPALCCQERVTTGDFSSASTTFEWHHVRPPASFTELLMRVKQKRARCSWSNAFVCQRRPFTFCWLLGWDWWSLLDPRLHGTLVLALLLKIVLTFLISLICRKWDSYFPRQ